MKLNVLKFYGGSSGRKQFQAELETERDLPSVNVDELPAAYVVHVKDLIYFRELKARVVDRGTKNKAKGLSKILLGHKKIPVVDGNFSDPGQLRRSVRTLLINAAKIGERNLYIIGAERTIFEALWKHAAQGEGEKTFKSEDYRSSHLDQTYFAGDEIPPKLLLDMLDYREEPHELTEKFKGNSVEAQLVRQLILRAAQVDDRVLILGDTGTGKEVVARAVHDLSRRRSENFVAVNCGGIPRDLFESELFGHEKNSFTGATRLKIGLWEYANNGTIFLDEIGELYPDHQVKILRVLEEGKIRRVGGVKEIPVNARVIAATNQDLHSMVLAKQFRDDLYYRLREFLIRTPALRDHPEDIPTIVQHFWSKIVRDQNKTLPAEIIEEIQSYGWPGNARQLRAVLTYLRSLFGVEKLSVGRLRAVFLLHGENLMPVKGGIPSSEFGLEQAESLKHLRRTDDIINSLEFSLRQTVKDNETDSCSIASVQTFLRFRLGELEMVCLKPLLFKNEAVFSKVYLLKGKLAYFQSLLQTDVEEALGFWERDVAGELSQAQSAISLEIDRLLASSS